MTAPQGEGKQPVELTDAEILAELRALVRRRVSEQAANATETEAGFDVLKPEQRQEFKDEISKRFPTKSVPQDIPPDPHKKNKDTTRKGPKRAT